jgi:hypothetical protein
MDRSEVGEWKGFEVKRSEDGDDDRETDKRENTFLGFFFWSFGLKSGLRLCEKLYPVLNLQVKSSTVRLFKLKSTDSNLVKLT